MKKKQNLSCVAILVTVFTFMNVIGLHGQGGVNITAGFGFPELINAGIRYEMSQSQLGVAVGFIPVKDERVSNIALNYWYHFAGSSAFSERRPWYGRLGIDYSRDKMEGSFSDKLVFLDMRGGREFNISDNFGISLDAGIMIKLYANAGDNDLGQFIYDIMRVLPAAGVSIYYRF